MHLGDLGVHYGLSNLDNLHKKGNTQPVEAKNQKHEQWSPYEENGGTVLGKL